MFLLYAFYIPSGIATLTTLIKSRQWGTAIGIHELGPNLGFVLAPIISEVVLYWFFWREVFVLLGIVALLPTGVFAHFGRGGAAPTLIGFISDVGF